MKSTIVNFVVSLLSIVLVFAVLMIVINNQRKIESNQQKIEANQQKIEQHINQEENNERPALRNAPKPDVTQPTEQ